MLLELTVTSVVAVLVHKNEVVDVAVYVTAAAVVLDLKYTVEAFALATYAVVAVASVYKLSIGNQVIVVGTDESHTKVVFKRFTLGVAVGAEAAKPSDPPALGVEVIAVTAVLPVVAVYSVVVLLDASIPV